MPGSAPSSSPGSLQVNSVQLGFVSLGLQPHSSPGPASQNSCPNSTRKASWRGGYLMLSPGGWLMEQLKVLFGLAPAWPVQPQ